MTESPRPKIPSILKKSNAKADDILMPSDTMDSEGSPVPGKSQDNEYSDDITVLGNGKSHQSTDEAPSSAKKKFNKTNNVNVKNLPAKDASAGLKKSTLNTAKGGATKDLKGGKKATETVKGDMEDDIEDIGEEKENRKEVVKGGAQKKGKKSADVEESEEKQVESGDEEDGVGKKGNRKVKVLPSKNAKGTVKEKKESSPEKKSGKKEEEVKEEEEEEEKPKEVAKPKAKGKTLLGVKDNKENSNAGKKSEEKKVEKEKDEEESKSKTKENGLKSDLLVRKKKKLLEPGMGKTVDKSADKSKEKDKKSDKKDTGTDKKKEVSSKKDKDKKDTDKKDKKKDKKEKKEKKPKKAKKKEEDDPEEDEAEDDEEDDEELDASKLSQLLDDDEEEEEDDSGDERDIMIFMRGADDNDDDIPKEEVNSDGEMQMISSKGNKSPVVDTYWKKNVRKSKGSSAKRKAGEMLNHQAYETDKILKMAKSTKVIMYSGLEQDDLDVLRTAVLALPEGFTLNESSDPKMTHLIYNGTKRTMKLLYAIAKRAWVLAPSFFYESVSVGYWIMEKECEFAGVKTKNFRDTYGPLFKDLRFYFNHGDLEYFQTINNPVNIAEIKKLVKLGGGKIVEKAEEAEVIIEDADNRKNSLAPKKFEGNQPHVISYKWIFDSLMQYTKLPYQEFNILM